MSHALNIARLKLGGLVNRFEGGSETATAGPRDGDRLIANRYRVKSLLGEGGMGRVLLAEDVVESRDVALKMMLGPRDVQALDVGFRQEFYTLSKLRHPGTVQVFDYGILPTGERYLTMELVRGRDLRELLHRGPMPIRDVLRVLVDLAQVLGFIHSRLFVHCDIKAENVRVSDKQVTKLMDFGLMFPLGTAGGSVRGTPGYLAPEVARGGVIDARTDIYSLGALAFELCAGRLPFEGNTIAELISAHLEKAPPALRSLRAEVPEGLERVVLKCLEKNPRDRYQDTAELLVALGEVTGRPIEAQTLSQRSSYLNAAELVGRGAEVATLDTAFAALLEGRGGGVYVGAPAGVGKTRLLQEFLLKAKLADVPSVLGQCRREGLSPLRSITQALAGLLSRTPRETLDRVAPVLVGTMPELARQGFKPKTFADPIDERAAIVEAVITWLQEVSAVRPLVVVLEDLHWADTATLELLNALTHQIHGMRVLLIGTFRTEEVDRKGLLFNAVNAGEARLLEIPPLGRADLASMVAMMLRGVELPDTFFDALYATTSGNCFFATESLRALLEDGSIAQKNGRWAVSSQQLSIPASIADAVAQRLTTLSPELMRFATVAAVSGRVLDLGLLEQVAGVQGDALFALIDEMVERQFVSRVDDRVMFTHDTVRDTIYRRLAPTERAQLHGRIGAHLEQFFVPGPEADPAPLAHHFSNSDDETRAVRYLLLAGARAFDIRAFTDASRLMIAATDRLEGLTSYPDKDAVLVATWARLVECTFEGIPAVGAAYARKLTDHWRRSVDIPAASRLMRRVMGVINKLPPGLRRTIKGKIYSERPFDPTTKVPFVVLPQLLQYLTLKSFAHGFRNDWADTFTQLDECAALMPDPESVFCAGTFAVRSLMHGLRGETGASKAAADSAFAIANRNVETVNNHAARVIFGNCLLLGPIGESFNGAPITLERIERSLKFAKDHNLLMLMFQSKWPLHVRACQTGETGEWQRARTELLDVVKRMGYPAFYESRLYFWDPYFHIQQGRYDEALEDCTRLERLGAQIEDSASLAQAGAFRAMVALERNDLPGAESLLEAALELSRRRELVTALRWAPLKAELLLARGEAAKAAAWLEEQVMPKAASAEHGTPMIESLAWRHHGEAVGGDTGIADVERALRVADKHGITLEQGFGHLSLAGLWLKRDRARAAEQLDAAEAIFTKAGNQHLRARVVDRRARFTMGTR